MSMRSGINVGRRLSGGGTGAMTGDELHHLRTNGTGAPVIQRAVVVEVIYDPGALTPEDRINISANTANPEYVPVMPRNSILARIVSNAQDLQDPTSKIFFPFFQPHFSLPIKAGEQVWVMFEDPSKNNSLGYWMTRVAEQYTVDDINYTHADRRFDVTLNPASMTTAQRSQNNNSTAPSFPNGGGVASNFSLLPVSGSTNPYDLIYSSSVANQQFTMEAVPRITKRANDFVLQGSNNAAIILGEDRTGPATRVTGSDAKDKIGLAGTIDIVVGRGRNLPTSDNADPKNTSPRVIENTRHKKEVNKTPFKTNKQDNPQEGDPDFQRDAGRLYLSMKTDGDKNFKIDFDNNSPYKDKGYKNKPPTSNEAAYFIAKADEIRLISSKKADDNNEKPQKNGTIKIIREADTADKVSLIYMTDDGIQIDGKKVYLGVTKDKGPDNEGEPYIKWTEFKKVVEGLQAQIDTLADFITNTVLKQVISIPANTSNCTPFSPDPAVVTMGLQATTAAASLPSKLTSDKNAASQAKDNAKSTKIFGE